MWLSCDVLFTVHKALGLIPSMAYPGRPSICEVEAGGLEVEGHLHIQFNSFNLTHLI